MQPILLQDATTASEARIAADLGFNCYAFQAAVDGRTVDVVDAAPDFADGQLKPSHHGIPILFPYPNRIRGGKYVWEGREFAIPESAAGYDGAGNAIHGFCLDRPWRIEEQTPQSVLGRFQLSREAPDRLPYWPADFVLDVRYTLRGSALRADIRVHNPDEKPLPWGFGTHPYFRLPLAGSSEPKHCLVQAPASQQHELVDCLPTGTVRPIPPEKDLRDGIYFDLLRMDDVLTGLETSAKALECRIIDEQAGLEVTQRCDPGFRELVVYTPPGRNAVCLEPYTCVTDAINLQQQGIDTGWRVLPPGEEFHTWIEIRAGLVVA